jgi:hypothetical protein
MGSDAPMTAAERATEYFQSLAPGEAKLGYATEAYKGRNDLAYALSRVPMGTPRPLRIIAAGAGFGGIGLARAVRVGEIPGATLTVFEKDAGIGGTWYENRYPGYVYENLRMELASGACTERTLDVHVTSPRTATNTHGHPTQTGNHSTQHRRRSNNISKMSPPSMIYGRTLRPRIK